MKEIREIWTERELAVKLGLPQKNDKSRQIGKWVAKGLKCVRLSDRRFFREEDVVKFFNTQMKDVN